MEAKTKVLVFWSKVVVGPQPPPPPPPKPPPPQSTTFFDAAPYATLNTFKIRYLT